MPLGSSRFRSVTLVTPIVAYLFEEFVQFVFLVPDVVAFRPNFGHACGLRFFAEAFLAEVIVFECVTAAHIVLAYLSGDSRGFVFEEAVEVGFLVIDVDTGAGAFDAGGLYFVVEGLLAQVIVFLGLVHGEVVLFYVAMEEAAAVPFFLGNQEQASVPLDRNLLFTDVGGDVFARDSFALHQILSVVPVFLIIYGLGLEHPVYFLFGVERFAFDDARTEAFFFHSAHQPGFGDVVLLQDLRLGNEYGPVAFDGLRLDLAVGRELLDGDADGAG